MTSTDLRIVALRVVLAVPLGACATGRGIPDYQPPGKPASPERRYAEFDLASSQAPFPLRLGREDVVRILVMGYPELTHDGVVQADGKVTLPLVGELQAAGRTTAELREDIGRALQARADPASPLRLEGDDSVRLVVWRAPELNHVATVQADGKIVLPLVGEVAARGRTIPEVQAEVKEKLGAYLREPGVSILPERIRKVAIPPSQISVLPIKLRSRQVVVLGEVSIPGVVPLQGEARAMDAIGASRYTENAQLDDVIIIRNPEGKEPQYRRLRLSAFLEGADAAQNVYLMDRDILFVPKTTIAQIDSFIDKFFARTRPLFDWWYAANAAFYANEIFRTTIEVNRLLLLDLRR